MLKHSLRAVDKESLLSVVKRNLHHAHPLEVGPYHIWVLTSASMCPTVKVPCPCWLLLGASKSSRENRELSGT